MRPSGISQVSVEKKMKEKACPNQHLKIMNKVGGWASKLHDR